MNENIHNNINDMVKVIPNINKLIDTNFDKTISQQIRNVNDESFHILQSIADQFASCLSTLKNELKDTQISNDAICKNMISINDDIMCFPNYIHYYVNKITLNPCSIEIVYHWKYTDYDNIKRYKNITFKFFINPKKSYISYDADITWIRNLCFNWFGHYPITRMKMCKFNISKLITDTKDFSYEMNNIIFMLRDFDKSVNNILQTILSTVHSDLHKKFVVLKPCNLTKTDNNNVN